MFDQPTDETSASASPSASPLASALAEWIRPLDADAPGGPNLEYDPEFSALTDALRGREETQFAPAEPPDWPLTRQLAQELLPRTRDLRVAVAWGRAGVVADGLAALPDALALVSGLLDHCWDGLHPQPDADDEDAFARQGPLVDLDTARGLLGDLRHAPLHRDRRLPALRLRDVEVALDRLPARDGDEVFTADQLRRLFADEPALTASLRTQVQAALAALTALRTVLTQRFGTEAGVRLKSIGQVAADLHGLLPEADAPATDASSSVADAGETFDGLTDLDGLDSLGGAASDVQTRHGPTARRGGRLVIGSRADALAALRQIREFLERTEPTNPAQLMLRRAERLIDKDFFALVREIAPGGIADAARILGLEEDALDASA
jgi:type VI secretion system protein ImpA